MRLSSDVVAIVMHSTAVWVLACNRFISNVLNQYHSWLVISGVSDATELPVHLLVFIHNLHHSARNISGLFCRSVYVLGKTHLDCTKTVGH